MSLEDWKRYKEVIDVATHAFGFGLAVIYVAGLLVANVYLSMFDISDFSMLRVRYLTTGFALLGFCLLPLVVFLAPVVAFRWLRGRGWLWRLSASFVSFSVVAVTAYLVLTFVVEDELRQAPLHLYAWQPSFQLDAAAWVQGLITWFSPIVLLVCVYAPLAAIGLAWQRGTYQRIALVVCVPVVLFGVGSVLTRFGGMHYPRLKPAFGGPTTALADVAVTESVCRHLRIALEPGRNECVLEDVILLHESSQDVYIRRYDRVLQIPRRQISMIAAPES